MEPKFSVPRDNSGAITFEVVIPLDQGTAIGGFLMRSPIHCGARFRKMGNPIHRSRWPMPTCRTASRTYPLRKRSLPRPNHNAAPFKETDLP